MNAPLVPPDRAGPRRPVPSIWRLAKAGAFPWRLAVLGLVVSFSAGLIQLLVRGRWRECGEPVVCIVGATALFWWSISRLRRAFAQGSEVHGRITHCAEMEAQSSSGAHFLRVVYVVDGAERVAQYPLGGAEIARLRASVGGEVTLIVHPTLETPLLRDLYLDP